MFAAVSGYRTGKPNETINTFIELGVEIPKELTVTKIVAIKTTQIEAFMASIDPAAFAGA
jgi:hypothetical protein